MARIDYLQVRLTVIDPINGDKKEIVFEHVKNIRFKEHATTITDARLPEELIITVPQGSLKLLPEWIANFCYAKKEYVCVQYDPGSYNVSFSFKIIAINDLDVRIISGGKK